MDPNRQASIAEASVNHRSQVERRPAVTARAVTRELVLVTVQAGEGAEVNHAAIVALKQAQEVSQERVSIGPLVRWRFQ